MKGTQPAEAIIAGCVATHRPGEHPRTLAIRARLTQVISDFVASGRADPKFVDELQLGERTFWAGASEALVAARLSGKVFLDRKSGHGPDFLVMDGMRRVWIEVICPEAMRVPDDWLDPEPNHVHALPDRELLLRWTAAIKQKANALLGADDGTPGYLAKGVVSSADAYVIAVNACRLRSGPFPSLFGISGFPFAAQAVFPIGPRQLTLSADTLDVVGSGHQYRPLIATDSGKPVETVTFLNPRYAPVSAIWALDLDGGAAIGNSEPSAVVHNPHAAVPITHGFLPADEEYVATQDGDDMVVTRHVPP